MAFEREIPEMYTVPLEIFKELLYCRGMPEAVQTWIDTHDYKEWKKFRTNS